MSPFSSVLYCKDESSPRGGILLVSPIWEIRFSLLPQMENQNIHAQLWVNCLYLIQAKSSARSTFNACWSPSNQRKMQTASEHEHQLGTQDKLSIAFFRLLC